MIYKKDIKKILIIKLRGIGDVVLSTIVLDNLKEEFPDSTIEYLTDSPSIPGLEGLEQVNSVIAFPRKSLLDRFRLIFKIKKKKYDLVLDFFSNPSTALITFFSGAKYRVGFPYNGRKYAYNFFGPTERDKYHSAQLHLEVLKNVSLNHFHKSLYFYISESDLSFASEYFTQNFSTNELVVGISPSGGWQSKKCDVDKFAEIGSAIIKKYQAKILILWGPSDLIEAKKIRELIGINSILAPETDIQQMAAFISKCDLLIANDSGPMHISTAVGTPVLSLHGPTNPMHQGPFGDKHEWINMSELDCIMCNLLECPLNHECFRDLPIGKVLEKIDRLIVKNNLQNKVERD